jgi:NADH-quinone oxidoreductase subunit F
MGSGGMIVMDDTTCMVEIARYFINFLMEESCGKCTPCREGLIQMNNILTRITIGEGKLSDIIDLRMLCEYIKDSALCKLGKSAVNPVLSTLNNFEDEYIEHIVRHRCPAGVCKLLTTFTIDQEICKNCGLCKQKCPFDAIKLIDNQYYIDELLCTKCGICRNVCPANAIFA